MDKPKSLNGNSLVKITNYGRSVFFIFLVLLIVSAALPAGESFSFEFHQYLISGLFLSLLTGGFLFFYLINQYKKQARQLRQTHIVATQNEEKYRLLAENTSDVVWLSDLNFNLIYISPSVEKMFGWKVSDRLKMSLAEKTPPKHIENLKSLLHEELEKDKIYDSDRKRSKILEMEFFRADGSSVWVEMNISMVRDKAGCPVGLSGITRNIDEKVKAREFVEKRLAVEKLLSGISRKAVGDSDIHVIINKIIKKTGLAMDVSRVYVFGYDPQNDRINNRFEWNAKNVLSRFDHLQQLSIAEFLWFFDKLKQGKVIKYKNVEEIPDEQTKNALRLQAILSILAVPLILNDKFQGFIGFAECRKAKKWHVDDVEVLQSLAFIVVSLLNRQKIETELTIKSRTIELSQIGKAMADLNGKITYANPTFLKYWRYQHPEEVLNKSVFDFWESNEEPGKVVAAISANGRWEGEMKGIRSDGSVFDVLVQASLVTNHKDKPICMQASFFDITERKIREQELWKAKEKAEESSRLKSAFLANMSHEIRTPMNGILGFINLLKEEDLSVKEKEEYTFMVTESGNRLLNTIDDIMECSFIEVGELEINKEETDLPELMHQMYTLFRPEADRKNIVLKMNCSEERRLIQTDKNKLERILYHLLNNALKFTENGTVEFGAEVKEEFIQFYIKDTGLGIPENPLVNVFEPFIQADMGLNRRHEGSGLGLSISKAYVEKLGGKIGFTSIKNEGSTFSFTIAHESEKTAKGGFAPVKISEDDFLSGRKILIAEDDYYSSLLLESSLKYSGARILKTQSGKGAVQMLMDNPDIALVLMDMKMPGMNGIEATSIIRQFNAHVPIIAQTALVLVDEKKMLLEAGCNDYISKPINTHLLLNKIKQLLN